MMSDSKIIRILTFDIEDWFHVLDNESTRNVNEWNNYATRIHLGVDRILNVLENNKLKATFFFLGWIAEKYPEVLKKVHEMGHEIGCHSQLHQLIFEQDKVSFKRDTEIAIKTIEDCIGEKVVSYRAPGFSISKNEIWAFEVLVENGILIDSSIFPASRGHGGFPGFPTSQPCRIHYKGIELKEFPINTTRLFGGNIVFSGGGYFRIFPFFAISHYTRRSNYIMTYFHPRDFDSGQPLIQGLSSLRRFKSYYGISTAMNKFERWINKFDFIDMQDADKLIEWSNSPVVYFE